VRLSVKQRCVSWADSGQVTMRYISRENESNRRFGSLYSLRVKSWQREVVTRASKSIEQVNQCVTGVHLKQVTAWKCSTMSQGRDGYVAILIVHPYSRYHVHQYDASPKEQG
jgi:ArsR family metal-binding transcriptional regulator